jgi:hypothetical protein
MKERVAYFLTQLVCLLMRQQRLEQKALKRGKKKENLMVDKILGDEDDEEE